MIKTPIKIPLKYNDFSDYVKNNLLVQIQKEEDCFKFNYKEVTHENLPFRFDRKRNQVMCRLHVSKIPKGIVGMREFCVLKVDIETKNGDSLKKYQGYGIVTNILKHSQDFSI